MQRVEVRVKGRLDKGWSDWFDGLAITHTDGSPDRGGPHGADDETVLTGPVADQAALYGLLAKLGALGVALLSVKVMEDAE